MRISGNESFLAVSIVLNRYVLFEELGITMEKSPGIPVEFDTNAPMYTFSTDAFEESIMPLLPMLSNFFAEKNIKVMILSVIQNLRLFLP